MHHHAGAVSICISKDRTKILQYQYGKSGGCMPEPDQKELQKETDIQERALDKIGEALGDLRRMGTVRSILRLIHACSF